MVAASVGHEVVRRTRLRSTTGKSEGTTIWREVYGNDLCRSVGTEHLDGNQSARTETGYPYAFALDRGSPFELLDRNMHTHG